ncbi:RHS repeat-associated core domain-containing protein [Streptomyces sp. NPDC051041]|uniref:RHS repeat-associated core domain-containing protein n=1 Tax=Streptomyces sp. NPDC051041 TaxID=3365640 RepID=UPI0037B1835B
MTAGGKSCSYLTDATGNVLGLVDATGKRTHTYGPTGLPRTTPTEAVPQPYRYAGTYLDPTGLHETGHRSYDPALDRFTQPDSSGQETNPCLHAGGDPINIVGPSGLLDFGAFVHGVFGGEDLAEIWQNRKIPRPCSRRSSVSPQGPFSKASAPPGPPPWRPPRECSASLH